MASVEHPVQWVTAQPLWPRATSAADRASMRRPTLLRMASDAFMDDLLALLDNQPATLGDLEARPESYRARPLGVPDAWTPPPPPQLKLYQPFHGHFNLVAASLVCGLPGLPDHAVDAAEQEATGFVLRRLSGGTELAWVVDPSRGKGWQPVAGDPAALAPFEERLPLFPVPFTVNGRRRRLHAGVLPTASVEALNVAPQLAPADVQNSPGESDPRMSEVDARVVGVLQSLAASTQPADLLAGPSLFLMLDLADFLARRASAAWDAILSGRMPQPLDPARALYTLLSAWVVPAGSGAATWRDALGRVWDQRQRIVVDGTTSPPLAFDVRATVVAGKPLAVDPAPIGALRAAVQAALGPAAADTSLVLATPKLEQGGGATYVVRCVFERPKCLPFRPPVVSDPSPPFALAGVFDPDAPARPVRINLPIDTSPAGLRKFPKNVAVLVSDQLRRQMNAASDAAKLIKGETADGGGFDLGMICSFSIPIITICAFIILIIFMILLNIVFWWLPFFRICWPVPKPKDAG